MKLLFRLVVALAILFVTVPTLTSVIPVQAQEPPVEEADIWLYPDDEGCVGDSIKVRGEYLYDWEDDDVWIYFELNDDWVELESDEVSGSGKLDTNYFDIPECAGGKHKIRVCDDDDEDDWFIYTYFTVKPKLELTKPSDATGSVDTDVTIKGTGFGEDEDDIKIMFYTNGSYVTVKSDITADEYGTWEATFKVPETSKGEHDILAEGDDTDADDMDEVTFEVEPGISLAKSSGKVGDTITVRGSGFEQDEDGIKITYDAEVMVETEAGKDGTWEASFKAPLSAMGKHKIDAYGEGTRASDIADKEFTISYTATMNPTQGHIGTKVTIEGNGFAANKSLTVNYDDTQIATSTTDSKGSFSINFSVPKSKYGNHTVTASDGSNTFSSKFVMESTPPAKPVLISPADASRIGFVSKVSPVFEWQSVDDVSGVSYSFQLASNPDFTSPILSRTDLTENSYTLTSEQALPYGTYYWRVKAIDGAQNDSSWITAYQFNVGLLPLWAFIAIVALLVVLIVAIVFVFVARRRSIYD